MARRSKSITVARAPIAQINWYKKKLKAHLMQVANSFSYWVGAAYNRNESAIVGDVSPQADIEKAIKKVVRQWRGNLDELSEKLATDYVNRLDRHSKRALLSSLKSSGFSITLKTTRDLQTALKASVEANAALIRNLTEDYLAKAQGIVWRGVQNGSDLQYIKKNLISEADIESRRAERVAVDQANKATQALTTERAKSIGVTEAYWQHNVGGSKSFRKTHEDFDNKRFYLFPIDGNEAGLYDASVGRYVLPAELSFCKCNYRIILPE